MFAEISPYDLRNLQLRQHQFQTYSACQQRWASILKAPDRFPIKNAGIDEDDVFPLSAFAAARRSTAARKREDKLRGMPNWRAIAVIFSKRRIF